MTDPRPSRGPVGGGILIAISMFVGAIGGALMRQPTLGLLIGLGVGALASLIVWQRDRRR